MVTLGSMERTNSIFSIKNKLAKNATNWEGFIILYDTEKTNKETFVLKLFSNANIVINYKLHLWFPSAN